MTVVKKIFLTILILAILAGVGFGVCYLISNSNSPNKVVELSVNPSVQFVVSASDKVVSVSSDNEDGDKMIAELELEGKEVNEAVKLYVECCSKANYIKVSLSGAEAERNKVELSVYGADEEESQQLYETIKKEVNTFFDDNGIFAYVSSKTTEYANAVKDQYDVSVQKAQLMIDATKLGVLETEEQLSQMSEAEIAKLISKANKMYEGLSYELRQSIISLVDLKKQLIAEAQSKIDNLAEGEIKVKAQQTLDRLISELHNFEEIIKSEIESKKEQAQQALTDAKQAIKTLVENNKDAYNEHIKIAQQNAKENKEAIQAWRSQIESR